MKKQQMLGDLKKFSDEQLKNVKDYFYSLLQTDNNKDKDIAAIVIGGNYTLLIITMAYMELVAEMERRCDVIMKKR